MASMPVTFNACCMRRLTRGNYGKFRLRFLDPGQLKVAIGVFRKCKNIDRIRAISHYLDIRPNFSLRIFPSIKPSAMVGRPPASETLIANSGDIVIQDMAPWIKRISYAHSWLRTVREEAFPYQPRLETDINSSHEAIDCFGSIGTEASDK